MARMAVDRAALPLRRAEKRGMRLHAGRARKR